LLLEAENDRESENDEEIKMLFKVARDFVILNAPIKTELFERFLQTERVKCL
jgi:hypothetical protein